MIGSPFPTEELVAADVLGGLGRFTVVVNDPPWSSLAPSVPEPARVVVAGSMELRHLEALAAQPDDAEVVVGVGGGTALDTAKYLAWTLGRPLVQLPTITSVDAGFTEAIGVRDDGRVRYVGEVRPELVAVDIDLIRAAPAHLNRAGIGDVLSCHTGLFDWRLAANAGHPPPWDESLAALGRTLLRELDEAVADVRVVNAEGVRFLVSAYRRIGAAGAAAGHSRFEEGSEHHWAYALEAATGARHVHGEIIALATTALSLVQGNDHGWVRSVVDRSGVRAHPDDLGVTESDFRRALGGLRDYVRAEGLDMGVADLRPIGRAVVDEAWLVVRSLPRRSV
ncbi:MAG TPA: iron-containing alcohol dehydrogenase [Acidimicrobiales bacterium]|nr:iron-containing alcohol dehydrogenase [Acidimicrobiales bacterium]